MAKEHLPIYHIQDFEAQQQKAQYFYYSSFSVHLQEHLFIREPHKHNFYIILFITQGSGTHTIDFKEYPVKPLTLFFLSPGQVHSWQLSEDADGFIIFFTKEFYLQENPAKPLFSYPFFNALVHNPVLTITRDDEFILLQLLNLLEQEYKEMQPQRNLVLSRYLDILLIKLNRMYMPVSSEVVSVGNEQVLLQSLERLIDQHYKEHKPVAFYADSLHVTPKHLNEVCKHALGKTTKELIQYRVLLEAQRLLVHADLTSTQIAAELGYYDNTYFFRFFKKQTGYTPEQFRAATK